jgi:hypothetical protein
MAKTIKIETLKARANFFFLNSGDDFAGQRKGMQSLVESFLHDANAYRGFTYLTKAEMKPGFSYGVEHTETGPKFPDESRIRFL